MAKIPHLQRRPSGYYYRRVVPKALRSKIGKGAIIVSLETSDFAQAKRACAKVHADVERQLDCARFGLNPVSNVRVARAPMTPEPYEAATATFVHMAASQRLAELEEEDRERLLREPPIDIPAECEAIELEASHYYAPDPDWAHVQPEAARILSETDFPIQTGSRGFWHLCECLNGAHLEHLKRSYHRVSGLVAPFGHRPTGLEDSVTPTIQSSLKSMDVTISQVLERYDADPKRAHVRAKTKGSAMATAKRLLLEVVGKDRPITDVTRDDLVRARDILLRLPPRATSEYRGMALAKVAEANTKSGGQRLHPKTVDNQLIWVTAIFNYAEQEQLILSNPARRLVVGVAKTDSPSRLPWDVDDLNRLFRSPVFTEGEADPSRFWVPLLCLFQGLRLNEACQLFSDDLQVTDGVPALRIAHSERRGQTTKKNDTRVVPVHPTLIDMGILKLFQTTGEPARIFPNITLDRYGSATNAYSKWFSREAKKQGVLTRGVVFHSFRHSYADALRRAGVTDERADALGGWGSKGTARRGYGQGYRPADLLPDLAKVTYPGLELSHVIPTF